MKEKPGSDDGQCNHNPNRDACAQHITPG